MNLWGILEPQDGVGLEDTVLSEAGSCCSALAGRCQEHVGPVFLHLLGEASNSSVGKGSACNSGDLGSIPGLEKIPWRRKWQPTPVFLPEESHGQRNQAGYSPWGFPGKNTGVDCHFLLQRIFPTQESNPGLLNCRQILYHLSYREALYTKRNISL